MYYQANKVITAETSASQRFTMGTFQKQRKQVLGPVTVVIFLMTSPGYVQFFKNFVSRILSQVLTPACVTMTDMPQAADILL